MVTRRLLLKVWSLITAVPLATEVAHANENNDEEQLQFHLNEAARIATKLQGGTFTVTNKRSHRFFAIVG